MSFGAAVLTFREGVEAALIIAIMLGYLRKVGRQDRKLSVWAGALSAVVLAVGFTLLLQAVGTQFDYPAKGIYEGLTSLLAVVMLTYMIFWMARQSRHIKGTLEHTMKGQMAQGAALGLFSVAFMTVAREGLETALFLSASAFQSSGTETLVGGLVGVAAALVLAWAMYVAGVRLQLRTFFKVTSLVLVVFAAAILRYAVHEFEEVGWIPSIVEHLWNTSAWLPTSNGIGAVLQALVGYTSQPSLAEVVAYAGYLLVLGYLLLHPSRRTAAPPSGGTTETVPASPSATANLSASPALAIKEGARD